MADDRTGRDGAADDTTFREPDSLRSLWASPFFRLLAINWLIGAFVSVMVLGGLMFFDTANLRSLILNSDNPVLPVVVLLFGLMITLCSAAMGAAVMALPSAERNDRGGKGGKGQRLDEGLAAMSGLRPALRPAPVRVRS
ncbi:hypothetical protein [Stappia sp. ES.058]|uniref:hypothetical protein n=1 Tax=Stappia sp. ES.058 TaxID=1881061 RepID=UPI00087A9912|nr:hypothetical protein [Stappia sp. ES.058]SDU15008.1 hypothetical protein SAMN05428979_1936 [Stappia sp. ES.058]